MKARENPFRTERLETIRYRFHQTTSIALLLDKLQKMKGRGALVGPEGSGKSTLMEELASALENGGRRATWFCLKRESPKFSPEQAAQLQSNDWAAEDVILLDGGELVSPLRFKIFQWQTRKAGTVLLTAHRPGLLPTLHTCSTSPMLLQTLLSDLLPENDLQKDVDPLFNRHRGNIREAFRECYMQYAER